MNLEYPHAVFFMIVVLNVIGECHKGLECVSRVKGLQSTHKVKGIHAKEWYEQRNTVNKEDHSRPR